MNNNYNDMTHNNKSMFDAAKMNRSIVDEVNIQSITEKNKINTINLDMLKKNKIINKNFIKLKILGDGELKTKIDITAHFASKQAQEKITKAGGKLNIIKK